jgi:hypothetical protein
MGLPAGETGKKQPDADGAQEQGRGNGRQPAEEVCGRLFLRCYICRAELPVPIFHIGQRGKLPAVKILPFLLHEPVQAIPVCFIVKILPYLEQMVPGTIPFQVAEQQLPVHFFRGHIYAFFK